MLKINRRSLKGLIFISALFVTLLSSCVFSLAQDKTTFSINLRKGTQSYKIITYDNETIEENIANFRSQEYWFDGAINISGATAKMTIRNWITAYNGTFELFNSLLVPLDAQVLLIAGGEKFNYTRKYVNSNYSKGYNMWWVYANRWNFTSKPFNVTPTHGHLEMVALENPADHRKVLDEFNHWYDNKSDLLEPMIDYYNLSLSKLNSSAYLWKLINNHKLIIPSPVDQYLSNLVDVLRLNDTRAEGNKLIIDRKSIIPKAGKTYENYTVEVLFTDYGIVSSMTFKDRNQKIFFKFESTGHSNDSITLVLILSIAFIAGMVMLHMFTRDRYK